MKQVVISFDFPTVKQQQYDNVWNDLRASGNEHPKGLLFHVGAPKPNGGWMVVDVWDTEEDFKNFGSILMPLLAKHDVPATQPIVMPAHYIYENHLSEVV